MTWRQLYAQLVFYPTLLWNFFLARVLHVRNWWDPIDPLVIVGGYPFRRDAATLFDQGVRAVVNTCEEYPGPIDEYQRLGIQQLRIPTTDFCHPTLADVERGVAFIQENAERGHVTYVHCKAGRARSATVAICWLIRHRGMTPEQAQQHLLRSRSQINPRLTRRGVVREFAQQPRIDGQNQKMDGSGPMADQKGSCTTGAIT